MKRYTRIKPARGQSAAGMVTGIIFCLIGVFFVIPTAGAFGWLWTLGALGITIYHAVNAFSDEGVASYEMVEEEEYHFGKIHHSAEVEQRLKMVEHLYREGKITKDEYDKKRQSILDEI